MKTKTKEFLSAALIRASRTAIQTGLSFLTIGKIINVTDAKNIVIFMCTAFAYSFLNSLLSGLPETTSNGILYLFNNKTEDGKEQLDFMFRLPKIETLSEGQFMTFEVQKISKEEAEEIAGEDFPIVNDRNEE